MIKFITLTGKNGKKIRINPEYIAGYADWVKFKSENFLSRIYIGDKTAFWVKETVEEIDEILERSGRRTIATKIDKRELAEAIKELKREGCL